MSCHKVLGIALMVKWPRGSHEVEESMPKLLNGGAKQVIVFRTQVHMQQPHNQPTHSVAPAFTTDGSCAHEIRTLPIRDNGDSLWQLITEYGPINAHIHFIVKWMVLHTFSTMAMTSCLLTAMRAGGTSWPLLPASAFHRKRLLGGSALVYIAHTTDQGAREGC